jgi:hypothetical protein
MVSLETNKNLKIDLMLNLFFCHFQTWAVPFKSKVFLNGMPYGFLHTLQTFKRTLQIFKRGEKRH